MRVFAVCVAVGACFLLQATLAVDTRRGRESKKLFGGYRITPHFCKPTRKSTPPSGGPSICMFNHECSQRNGQVVGACMDGFLFGACCQLPTGTATGELAKEPEMTPLPVVTPMDNDIAPTTPSGIDIMSIGVSQIAQSLLNPTGILPTAQDNAVVQVAEDHVLFSTTGVTHSAPDTIVLGNKDGGDGYKPDFDIAEDRKTTVNIEESTVPYSEPMVHISITSNAPSFTPTPGFQRPMFRPKPSSEGGDKYVLVPTIIHSSRPNRTQEDESIVNILHLLNQTTIRPNSYPTSLYTTPKTTSKKPPSTSYVYSTTVKPRRTTTPLTTTKKKTKPTKQRKPTTTKLRPSGFSTVANSPTAFTPTSRPPSTSYVYSPTSTSRPPGTINTHIAGPGFAVTSSPIGLQGQYSTYPSPAPTLIVLSSLPDEDDIVTKRPQEPGYSSPPRPSPGVYNQRPGPNRRPPFNSVTINNHVTQNIYSTSERPQPTVLITPKPSSATPTNGAGVESLEGEYVEVGTNVNELINFPPVRNPNLNMSNPTIGEDDITTPSFIEDDALNDKMESFVNNIIQGLQEPFQGLKDVVYNKNSTSPPASSGGLTTKKPAKKQGTTTRRPATTTRRTTTRRPTTRRPVTTTRRPATTTTKRSRTTRRPITTTQVVTTTSTTESFIEQDVDSADQEEYRDQCGIRPLLKTGRIVGGKGATFGEFPWQVLVRESTWLGLFTKNKCGGVLVSSRYVMTAAHCQPGFLASLVAVFGEFDISGDLESRRPLSRNVRRVIVHRKYDAATFENDLALLELESPLKFDAHIIPICLPRDTEDFTGRMATVTGWGRLKYGGGVPSVLQEVQVPIMENHVCQEMFRTAGHSKVILDSFLCAGYANGQKDSCEGDSGGPLVLQRPDGRYQLAGTVSHGIKCAAPYLPGVYMRTTFYKPWIVAITGIDTS